MTDGVGGGVWVAVKETRDSTQMFASWTGVGSVPLHHR